MSTDTDTRRLFGFQKELWMAVGFRSDEQAKIYDNVLILGTCTEDEAFAKMMELRNDEAGDLEDDPWVSHVMTVDDVTSRCLSIEYVRDHATTRIYRLMEMEA